MINDNEINLAKRLHHLRKEKGLSQPELGKLIGTSGAIIGRYERDEMTPSVDVAKKLADALDVTMDYLVANKSLPNALQDKAMMKRWQQLDSLNQDDKDRVLSVIDSLVRDAKARQAYSI
jgi:transcriptional regulator with XRE-family HTH domain